MTTLEKALLEENEHLTKMIEDERSKHELETMNLQQDCEKELSILQAKMTELTKKVKSLSKDCNDTLMESLQQQKDMYESSISRLEEKLENLEEEFQNLREKYKNLQIEHKRLQEYVENL